MPIGHQGVEGTPATTQLDCEREEAHCSQCGLVYQQNTSGYEDHMMHAACPRCMVLLAKDPP